MILRELLFFKTTFCSLVELAATILFKSTISKNAQGAE